MDVLRDGDPWDAGRGEVVLRGGHGGEGPPALVVVAVSQGAEEVVAYANVGEEPGRYGCVVGRVACVVPVVEESAECASGFPPVIRGWKHPCRRVEVCGEVIGEGGGRGLDAAGRGDFEGCC